MPAAGKGQRLRGFMMSDYLYNALVRLADLNGHTIAEEARRAIEHWVDSAGLLPDGPDDRYRMTPGRSNTRKVAKRDEQ